MTITLKNLKKGVADAFGWIRDNLPNVLADGAAYERVICERHDHSKNDPEEYEAYDLYFYGGNRSFKVVEDFNKAWLRHIHKNPHHWQHWVLINDEEDEGIICIEIPYNYIIEMICDWWSFGWKSGDLNNLFEWYDEHKDHIKMHKKSRKILEDILRQIREKLKTE